MRNISYDLQSIWALNIGTNISSMDRTSVQIILVWTVLSVTRALLYTYPNKPICDETDVVDCVKTLPRLATSLFPENHKRRKTQAPASKYEVRKEGGEANDFKMEDVMNQSSN